MTRTIRLDHVLREAVTTPYCNLVTRPTGAAVRHRIEAALAEPDCLMAFLDFSQVGLLDFSCADEIVAKLLLRRAPLGRWYVVLQGLREEHGEAIDHVLSHHRLAVTVVSTPGGEPGLLGWATPDTRAAFHCVARRGPLDAACCATELAWSPLRAANALRALAAHRVVRRVEEVYHSLPVA